MRVVAKIGGWEHKWVKWRECRKDDQEGCGHTIGEGKGQGGVSVKAQDPDLGTGGWWRCPETVREEKQVWERW